MAKFVINEEFLQQVETLQILIKNNIAGLFGGNHRTRNFGSSCEFADYRDYIAGDDITKIDWNAFARFEKLYLKLFLDERQMHTRIYIDASRSMDYGKGRKAEQALRIAALIAYVSVCDMDKVSVYAIRGGTVEEVFVGVHGKDMYLEQIGKLNDIVFDGDSRISEALLPASVGYGDGLSVIISDFLTDDNYEDAIDYLCSKRRDVFCVQVLTRDELNPKIRGKAHLFDSENIKKTYRRNIDKQIIEAYRKAVEYVTSRIRNYCEARGANYLLASADQSVGEIFLGKLSDMGVVK